MIVSFNIINDYNGKNIKKTPMWKKTAHVIKKIVSLHLEKGRDVAQPGSALRSGRRGRKFESCHPDQQKKTA